MTIPNTAGWSFLGPGSEWLWALLQVAVLAATGLLIFGQLRAIRTANALSELRGCHARWDSAHMSRARLSAATRLRQSSNANMDRSMSLIAESFADLYSLRGRGVLSERDVMEAWAARSDGWWALLGPAVTRYRDEERSRRLYLGFEELATLSRRKAAHWGITVVGTDAAIRATLIEKAIERARANLDAGDVVPAIPGAPASGPAPTLTGIGKAIGRLLG